MCIKKTKIADYLHNKRMKLFTPLINEAMDILTCILKDEENTYCEKYFTIQDFSSPNILRMSFHIKECPGWLFGIWWEPVYNINKLEKTKFIKGEFFCQYELDIDKFKPSRSELCIPLEIEFNKKELINVTNCNNIKELINFISLYPELAWYRDYNLVNLNYEYIDIKLAKKEFNKHLAEEREQERKREEINKIYFNFIKTNIVPTFKTFYIIDFGENWFPRYDLITSDEDCDLKKFNANFYDDLDEIETSIELYFEMSNYITRPPFHRQISFCPKEKIEQLKVRNKVIYEKEK